MNKLITLFLRFAKKEACPKCGSNRTTSNKAGMWHCWDCEHSWRGKDY